MSTGSFQKFVQNSLFTDQNIVIISKKFFDGRKYLTDTVNWLKIIKAVGT